MDARITGVNFKQSRLHFGWEMYISPNLIEMSEILFVDKECTCYSGQL